MNEGLFEKYRKVIQKKKNEKQEVIDMLQELTGIEFIEQELQIEKKVISFHVSSVKKSIVLQKNIQLGLKEKGYTLK